MVDLPSALQSLLVYPSLSDLLHRPKTNAPLLPQVLLTYKCMYCFHFSWNEPERIQLAHVSVDGAVVGVRTKINTFTLASHISCLETGGKWNSVCLTNEKVEREPLTTSRTFSPVASHSPGTLHMHSGGPAPEELLLSCQKVIDKNQPRAYF